MSYAPSAPPEIWAVQDIDAGTKITVMAMWSWADHEEQREVKTTTVYAKMREGMTPTECLISKLVEQTGAKPRAVREHLTKAKAAGYVATSGRAATLYWPPVEDAGRIRGHLYVLVMDDGLIKVGRTSKPDQRLSTHAASVARLGGQVTKSWTSRSVKNSARIEAELLRELGACASARRGREWFVGLSFDDVVAIAARLCS